MTDSAHAESQKVFDARSKEREFYATPLGVAFHKFKNAHGRAWADDAASGYNDSAAADRRANLSWKAAEEAEREFRALLEPLAMQGASR